MDQNAAKLLASIEYNLEKIREKHKEIEVCDSSTKKQMLCRELNEELHTFLRIYDKKMGMLKDKHFEDEIVETIERTKNSHIPHFMENRTEAPFKSGNEYRSGKDTE